MKNKISHNKRRNSIFLFEILNLELTSALLKKDQVRQKEVFDILKEFFSSSKPLKKELNIYEAIRSSKDLEKDVAEKILFEAKRDHDQIDKNSIFQQQTKLLSKINKNLGNKIFDNFVPDYKYLASLSVILNGQGKIKNRIILEQDIIDKMSKRTDKDGTDDKFKELQNIDALSFKILMKKFDEKYKNKLIKEQKELLSNYVLGFSDRKYIFEDLFE